MWMDKFFIFATELIKRVDMNITINKWDDECFGFHFLSTHFVFSIELKLINNIDFSLF